MELLGIEANMQGSGNYPNFYFSRDLKGVVGGSIWPQISEDKMVNIGHSSKGFLSPLSAGLYVECGREALKQIMLKQEALFRDQIYELHRLYKRQREFIAEMKKESLKRDICVMTTQSDVCKSMIFGSLTQDAHEFPVYSQLSISGEKKTSLLSILGVNIQTGSDSILNGICSKNPYFSESKNKILGKGMFDLELPTDGKHLNIKDELTKVPEMSNCHLKRMPDHLKRMPDHLKRMPDHLKRMPEIVHISERKPFLGKIDLNTSLHGDFSTTGSLLKKTKVSVDLNDLPNLEDERGCQSVDLVDATGQREILFHDLYGKDNSKFLVFSEQDVHGRKDGLSSNGYSESVSFYDRSKIYQPEKDIANSSLSSSTTSLIKSAQGSIEHHILDAKSSEMLIENEVLAETDLLSIKNSRSSIGSDSASPIEGSFCSGAKSKSIKEESRTSFKASANWTEGQIDLNVCINEEFLATSCCSTETKLEVPISRRKDKHSSTTGEFDDSQVGSNFLKSVQDDGKPLEDLDAIAAESLVSISSSSLAQECQNTISCLSVHASCESLCWFAEIASSMGADLEKAEISSESTDASDSEELFPNCMDDFEIMTLELKETKVEGCSMILSNHQDEAVKTVSLTSCQVRKGRARRCQRKNFQTEILPSLATLSRYEVTEDIQTIGGLMDAASLHSVTGVAKTTSGGRTAWTRGKRRLYNSSSNITETVMGSIMDRVSNGNGLENKERKVIVWGNITRGRRGQRYPACNRKIILGQV